MLSKLDRLAYRSQHFGIAINATIAQEAVRIVTRMKRPEIDKAMFATLDQRLKALYARDLQNVDDGLYPKSLLFDFPLRQFARAFPKLLRDTPRVLARMRSKNYKDIPVVDKERFPAYYRRNFHWQTDGYFSEHSAEVYELGVELLFRGTANVMRRQIIPPITRFARDQGGSSGMKILDVACGTGPTLHQLAVTHSQARLYGVDLSPAYVKTARKRLEDAPDLTLAVENAEHLPYADGWFDVVTSTYLFHELPRNARRNVMRELFRVCRPGGLVVIQDSAQLSESASLEAALRGFPAEFHEPFYADYLGDDLAGMLEAVGFVDTETEAQMVAKVVTARKPGGTTLA